MESNIDKFTGKAENYEKFRPSYPIEILNSFYDYNLNQNSIIADIGSGTGKLTKIFLENGNIVYAVEPNDDMRNMAISTLNEYKNFISIKGSAEITTLQNKIIDFVTVGQAFHWFNPLKALDEFKRILKNNGVLALVWNNGKTSSAFMQEYENILDNIKNHNNKNHRDISDETIEKYYSKDYKKLTVENIHELNFNEILGRVLSSSCSPKENTKEYYETRNLLKEIFNKYKQNDKIIIEYETVIYIGRL